MISIHAPTWGATQMLLRGMGVLSFQSTHPRGVRLYQIQNLIPLKKFQSTHPRGVRQAFLKQNCHDCCISIHAPTWGATYLICTEFVSDLFQSTHPRGVRLLEHHRSGFPQQFQSTHPRGVRLKVIRTRFDDFKFQSTHPRGVRLIVNNSRERADSFQSTHPRGVRRARPPCQDRGRRISIHAPTWGATRGPKSLKKQSYEFQSTHPRGVRL